MRGLLALIVVLVLLAVAADRAAWYVAEQAVATAVADSAASTGEPEVDIRGFPFLTQAFRGNYERIDVRMTGLTAEEGVTVDELDTQLTGVRIPLRDALDRSVSAAPVDSARATGRMSFAALDAAAAQQIPSSELTASFGAGSAADRVTVDGTYRSPIGDVALSGEARLLVQDGELVITLVPESLNLPGAVSAAIARLLGVAFVLPPLPFGFAPESVAVTPAGVTLTATATDTTLTPQ